MSLALNLLIIYHTLSLQEFESPSPLTAHATFSREKWRLKLPNNFFFFIISKSICRTTNNAEGCINYLSTYTKPKGGTAGQLMHMEAILLSAGVAHM
jgi:hypothetical protein